MHLIVYDGHAIFSSRYFFIHHGIRYRVSTLKRGWVLEIECLSSLAFSKDCHLSIRHKRTTLSEYSGFLNFVTIPHVWYATQYLKPWNTSRAGREHIWNPNLHHRAGLKTPPFARGTYQSPVNSSKKGSVMLINVPMSWCLHEHWKYPGRIFS